MSRLLGPLFVLLWSSGYLAGALGTRDTPALALTTWRFLIAATLLVALAVATRAPWPRGWRAWRDVAVTGLLLQGVQFGAGYVGIAMGVPAGLAALILCLSPVLVALLAGPVLGERMGPLGRWGSAIALLGALVAGAHHVADGGGGVAGIGFLLLGLVGFASGTLYQKRMGATMDLRTGTAVQLIVAAAVVGPLAALTGPGLVLPTTTTGIGALAWLAVANSVGASVLLFVLLRRGTSAATSGLLYLVPPVTAILAVPVLGQPVEPQTVAGLALTLVGVVLVNRSARQTEASDSRRSSSSVSSSSSTGSSPVSCSGVRALAIGAATVGCAASQPSATAATGTPWAAATSSSTPSTRRPRSSR
jgi:drug/metabolite transporter (DMT)-like permease